MRNDTQLQAGRLLALVAVCVLGAPLAAMASAPATSAGDSGADQLSPAVPAAVVPAADSGSGQLSSDAPAAGCGPKPEGAGAEPQPLVLSPDTAIQELSGLPECGYGRVEDGCCGSGWNHKTRWKCASYCCIGNQCGLLCEEVWCEYPCIY